MPDEIGVWSAVFSWTDGTPGDSVVFEAVPSENKGFIRMDPAYDHHMMYDGGGHFFWNGDAEWFFLSDDFSQEDRFAAIAFLSEHKVNNLLMTMVNDHTNDVYPWAGDRDNIDRDRFNLARLRDWEEVVIEMGQRDLIADLWFYADDSYDLYPPPDSPQEDLYFRYIIARFASFANVTWNLALEYQEYRTSSWVESRAQYVRDHDPWNRLLAVHQLSGSYAFPGNENLDHTSLQSWYSFDYLNALAVGTREQTAQAGRPIPVFIEEFFIEGREGTMGSFERFRHGIWAITLGGGYFKTASLGWLIGTPYQEAEHFALTQILYEIFALLPYWEMIPDNDLASAGYALVRPGLEYLVYLPEGGPVTVDLSAATDTLSVEWYDPNTGEYQQGAPVEGGGPVDFTAPDTENWILHLGGYLLSSSAKDRHIRNRGRPLVQHVYPNPWARSATIELDLPSAVCVSLSIIDPLGCCVAVLLRDEPLPPGRRDLVFEGRDHPSGVYFYVLETDRIVEKGRLLRLR